MGKLHAFKNRSFPDFHIENISTMSSSYKRVFEIMRSFKVHFSYFLHGCLCISVGVHMSECRYLQKPKMLDPIELELQVKHRICKAPSHHFLKKLKFA